MKHLLYIVPLLAALVAVDRFATERGTIGWERNSVFDAQRRWRGSAARGAVLLGSSTSVDWLPRAWLAPRLGLRPQQIVDAHVNGCHQDCSWAQVRRLLAEGRRYDTALYGTNQFQLCEYPHSKRILQQRMLLPARDIGALLWHYRRAEQPLTNVTRFFGGALFESYADTAVLQRRWSKALFGAPRPRAAHRWHHRGSAPPAEGLLCPYAAADVRYKLGYSEALLADLARLAGTVYLLLLPDENLARDDVDVRRAWGRHRALHRGLAARWPAVRLVDLSTPEGARAPEHFRDGVHVNAAGARLQQALFARRLAALRSKPRR